MRFLTILMLLFAGVAVTHAEFELSYDAAFGWILYAGFYYMGGQYLDKYVNKRIKEVLDEKNTPKAN